MPMRTLRPTAMRFVLAVDEAPAPTVGVALLLLLLLSVVAIGRVLEGL